jgi:hypothetical protein
LTIRVGDNGATHVPLRFHRSSQVVMAPLGRILPRVSQLSPAVVTAGATTIGGVRPSGSGRICHL